MSEDAPEVQGQSGTDSGMYGEYLEQFPEEVRETAEQVFKEWDANVTRKFQEYEPYKQFTDYDPQVIMASLNLLSRVADNPREVYDLMGTTYGFGEESGQGQEQVQPQEYNPQDQGIDYQAQIEELRQMMQEQNAVRENESAMAEFQGLLYQLKEQYGDYDDDYVLSKIAAGVDPEEAVQGYFGFVEQITGRPAGPQSQNYPVLGGEGGVPSNDVDFNKLSNKETKDIIAQYLIRAQQE